MIQAIIERSETDHSIRAFHIEGHAEFAQSGEDIVCAGVSAITVGTINAIEVLLDIRMDNEMKEGWLSTTLPTIMDVIHQEKVQLLLESMVVMLESIQSEYGEYFRLKDKFI